MKRPCKPLQNLFVKARKATQVSCLTATSPGNGGSRDGIPRDLVAQVLGDRQARTSGRLRRGCLLCCFTLRHTAITIIPWTQEPPVLVATLLRRTLTPLMAISAPSKASAFSSIWQPLNAGGQLEVQASAGTPGFWTGAPCSPGSRCVSMKKSPRGRCPWQARPSRRPSSPDPVRRTFAENRPPPPVLRTHPLRGYYLMAP